MLGGAPQKQLRLAALLGPGVVSVDGNSHLKASRYGDVWQGGGWQPSPDAGPDFLYRTFARSCANIAAAWNAVSG